MCEMKAVPDPFKDDRDWFSIMNFAGYRAAIAKTDHQREFWMSVFNRLRDTFGDGQQ